MTTHTRLVRNQAHPGYSVVILREHATDMGELDSEQLSRFWSDVQRAGGAITTVFAPRKIDYLVMGHRMPHLHCHLLPQHPNDDPLRNVDISDGPSFLTAQELQQDLRALRAEWGAPE
ncbi:HIT family protein [Microbacterium sp. EST19A]|uniref:HIT family protein n=1 Tax=Microbacterium sp. EST19A TaxID=2862681 RepID=UPI001CBB9C6D|nr:HIT family protein [Microbacterium sp. EST19A]